MKDFDDIIYGLYEIPIIKQAFDLTFVSKVDYFVMAKP